MNTANKLAGTQYKVTDAASKLLTQRVETKLLAVCNVTGIAVTIDAPAIPGLCLEYTNPLAHSQNFLSLADQPASTLHTLESPILAGLLLAIMNRWELLVGEESSAERNLLLQRLPPASLIQFIKFFAANLSTDRAKYSSLPRFHLQSKEVGREGTSTTYASLKAYVDTCRNILCYTATEKEAKLDALYALVEVAHNKNLSLHEKMLADAKKKAARSLQQVREDNLKRARTLTKELMSTELLSDKLAHLLKTVLSGDTIFTIEATTRSRICEALRKRNNAQCNELASIISNHVMNNEKETLFCQPTDVEIAEDIQQVEAEQQQQAAPRSLADILKARMASKIAQPSIAEQVAQHFQEEQQTEEIEDEEIEDEEIEEMEQVEDTSDIPEVSEHSSIQSSDF